MMLGVFGATMFYGDSVITPAISVLGAIEGLEVAAPGLEQYVVPLTIIVLVACIRRKSTAPPASAAGSARSWWSGSPRWPSWA